MRKLVNGPLEGCTFMCAVYPGGGARYVKHRDANGKLVDFTFQNTDVHCPIISVAQLVQKDCWVTFHKARGYVLYPDGSKLRFVARAGVFFVQLNVVHPGFHRQGSA